jgi:bifunctional non-homologous end joining protein LigD
MADKNALAAYNKMRDFAQSPEPEGEVGASGGKLSFVVQKHAARSLHYDFRLELDGTLKSWAVPKGPSLDPADKRMAVQVEDHPLSYANFEGVIPPKHYGAGTVIVWDRGTWTPQGDVRAGYRDGKLKFELDGDKLHGGWALVRMRPREGDRQTAWLLMKERDEFARSHDEFDVVVAEPGSVLNKGKPSAKATAEATQKAPDESTAKQAAAVSKPESKPASTSGTSKHGTAKLPDELSPQLATLVDSIPQGDDWLYEIKFDGYRLLTRVDGDDVRCFTRNGKDWSSKLPALIDEVRSRKLAPCWLDGELVVLDDKGVPDFQSLQNAFDTTSTSALTYFVFDLPFFDGHDLRQRPLIERRELLRALIGADSKTASASKPGKHRIRFSDDFAEDPAKLLESAGKVGLEGLIGKRKGSHYRSARSTDWVKLKTQLRQEFVIGGYTDPKGSRDGLGSLLLGIHDDKGALKYAGNVGTGFDVDTLLALKKRLDALHSASSPFADKPAKGARGDSAAHWVKPTLLAEISFGQWTDAGRIRHAVFHGLREDKSAARIVKETPKSLPDSASNSTSKAAAKSTPKSAMAKTPTKPASKTAKADKAAANAAPIAAPTVRVTHAERVIDADSGLTKGELVAYYAQVAPLMLEHLKERPVAFVRAPAGVKGPQFFQKHAEANEMAGVVSLDKSLDPGNDALLMIASSEGLTSAAQMNVIEFHTWNMLRRSMPRADRMTFDLDPGSGVEWPAMREASQLLKSFLDDIGLGSFIKTSGGKGMHVVVPLQPRHEWQLVREFAQAVVVHLAEVIPQRFVAKSGPRNRVGKIFIDYLRNNWGATTAAAWSARARPGVGVSVPIDWSELDSVKAGDHWTVRNAAARFAQGNQPWAAYSASAQTLTKAMKAMGFKPSKAS